MSAIDDLPPLRDVIRKHELSAQKSLGQNFLLDLNLTARIARGSGPVEGACVVEVGPGPGGLTRALLALGAARVIAIERDRRCIAALAEVADAYPGRLEVIEGDALKVDVRPLIGAGPASTLLLVGWLSTDPWPPWFASLTLMFQREVAERIVAVPGSKSYGRLAVLAGWRTEARLLFDVAPSAFVPPPKVTSSVVHLVPRADPLACELKLLERVTEAAFGQRRKMLRQSLKSLGVDTAALLDGAGVTETARAEEIDVPGFVRLANVYGRLKSPASPEAAPLAQ
ncbi:MAG: 16S rRNA (adenine(1518)-N(6)/adenine(1519)-N(6))-dimethyltransferase [Rhizobiales bacterium 32-66-8]|nr:MAG: 16S rRNA (adenine(1518)-N(6)/adenine(1519)-N(6))-dimethyltransferase [Rhizobiales bacterium 32-66-8]